VHRQGNPSAQISEAVQKRAASKSEHGMQQGLQKTVRAESRTIQPQDKPSEGRVTRLTRPKEMVVKSQSEIDEENYGWQDSREAGDQALNRRMFLNLDERT
jgi:hypothetical protein